MVRTTWLRSVSLMLTLAFGTVLPVASRMVPPIVPEMSWAIRPVAKQAVSISVSARGFIFTNSEASNGRYYCNFRRLCHPNHKMSIVTGALDRDLPLPLYHQLQSV